MTALDWLILGGYLAGMIGLSIYLGKNQQNQEDYFVGGRRLPWWAIGISTMATQTSAISFISKPAFVALKPGGGLTWLQYEMAVPLAIIAVMIFLVPLFRKLELISVYEYLEHRFDASIRYLVSGVFLLSRAFAAGIVVYATAIVLSVCLGIPLWLTILIIGAVTVIYDVIGGMPAVVYSDVIQMVILLSGIVICIVYAAEHVGGFGVILNSLPPERLNVLDMAHGLGDGSETPFWGFLFGGFFLFVSYYGTDQSQVQRELSAESIDGTKRSLFINGISRFPLGVLYILLGMAVGAAYQLSPELQAAVPEAHPDYLVPQYIMLFLPSGLRAILFAALLAATMSSLDSVLNSLSAATMRDFVGRLSVLPAHDLRAGKIVTLLWGIFITIFAFYADQVSDTVVEAVNKIGSAFYGPILAAFLMGILSRSATTRAVFTGIVSGVLFNLLLWAFFPDVYWMWWNAIGCAVTMLLTGLHSYLWPKALRKEILPYTLTRGEILREEHSWRWGYLTLLLYFVLIVVVLFWVQAVIGGGN